MAAEDFPTHDGVNTLMLYSLSPNSTSQYAEVKVCQDRCQGGHALSKLARILSRTAAIVPAVIILTTLSIIDYI